MKAGFPALHWKQIFPCENVCRGRSCFHYKESCNENSIYLLLPVLPYTRLQCILYLLGVSVYEVWVEVLMQNVPLVWLAILNLVWYYCELVNKELWLSFKRYHLWVFLSQNKALINFLQCTDNASNQLWREIWKKKKGERDNPDFISHTHFAIVIIWIYNLFDLLSKL